MDNSDMEGSFLGGGEIAHVMHDGEVYLSADHLSQLLFNAAYREIEYQKQTGNQEGGLLVQWNLILSEKLADLRSELMKREIEASFNVRQDGTGELEFGTFFD